MNCQTCTVTGTVENCDACMDQMREARAQAQRRKSTEMVKRTPFMTFEQAVMNVMTNNMMRRKKR